jgi:SNF2 family DNA or RNA helicase
MKFLLANGGAGLLLDPGLGKTSISLAAFKILRDKGLVRRALVIAPIRPCYLVWPKEIAKWKDFNGISYEILHGARKEDALHRSADLYIINPDGLAWFKETKAFAKLKPDLLIVDESSQFKKTDTKRFRLLEKHLGDFKRRWILTGSPAPNGLLDLFGQIKILDFGRALGQYITYYRMSYFAPAGYGGFKWKINEGAEPLIHNAIKHLVVAMKAEDYIDMPKEIVNPVSVVLEPAVFKIYTDMEFELITKVKNHEVTAFNAAVAMNKCSQIANGGVYLNDRSVKQIHEQKAEAVLELVEELQGTPALVAYEYEHDLKRLLKVLGKKTPYIGSGVSMKRCIEIEREWNKGNIPVLLGQPASMAHGLNFQESGNHVIWHSLIWNFEHYDQFNRRVRRSGQKAKRVFIHHIIAKNTVDEIKVAALASKDKTQKGLFKALKTYVAQKKR